MAARPPARPPPQGPSWGRQQAGQRGAPALGSPVPLAPGGREGSSLPKTATSGPVGRGRDRDQAEPAQPRGGGERAGRGSGARAVGQDRQVRVRGCGGPPGRRLRVSRRLRGCTPCPHPTARAGPEAGPPPARPVPCARLSGLRQALPAPICLCPGRAATPDGGRGPSPATQPGRPLLSWLQAPWPPGFAPPAHPLLSPCWGQK